jgi:flavin-dependent dehydrogenase
MASNQAHAVVVGASFAGLACARAASVLGLRVTVLDRKPEPGATPHTTGILVREAAETIEIPRHLVRRIDGVRLYSPRLRWVDLERPGYAFYATDMPGLARWMAGEAAATGVELAMGTRFRGAFRADHSITVLGGPRADYLIGADGARSQVARTMGLATDQRVLMGVEAEYHGLGGVDRHRLHVFMDRTLAPGYIGWVVPGIGISQVGLAVSPGHRPDLPSFVAKLRSVFDFDGAEVVGHRAGAIPAGGVLPRIGGDRVLLVGDAAGMVSPLTAGGIHNALRFGRLAGRAVADHLLDGGPDPAEVLAGQASTGRIKLAMRALWEHAPPNAVLDRVGFSRPALTAARLVLFHSRGLLSADGWKALVEPAQRAS